MMDQMENWSTYVSDGANNAVLVGDDPMLSLGDPGCNRSGGYHETGSAAKQNHVFTNPNVADNPLTTV